MKLNESIIKNLNEADVTPDTPEFSVALTEATYYVNEAAKLYRQYANWAADIAADASVPPWRDPYRGKRARHRH